MRALVSKLISPAGLVALVCFFLPWLTVNCSGTPIASDLTGLNLARPMEVANNSYPGESLLYLAPAAAALVLLVGLALWTGGKRPLALVALLGGIVVAAVPLYFQYRLAQELSSDPMMAGMLDLEWQIGFWGVVVGGVAAALFALLNLFNDQPTP